MTNKYLSQSAYAKSLGLSSTAIMKIRDQLDWVTIPGKKKPHIDPKGPKTLKFEADRAKKKLDDPDLFKATRAASKRKKNKPPPTDQIPEKHEAESYDDSGDDDQDIDLKKEKIRLQNEKLKLEIDQKRSNLIEKDLTDIFFGKMYQIDSDQLKQLGNNLSPKLFGIINERNKIKSNDILKILDIEDKEIKEEIESILNSGEKEVKTKMVGIFEDAIHSILKSIKDDIDNFLALLEADAI